VTVSYDTRKARHDRRSLDDFARKGVCGGSLSSGFVLPIGTAVGQLPEAGPLTTNILPNSYNINPAVNAWQQFQCTLVAATSPENIALAYTLTAQTVAGYVRQGQFGQSAVMVNNGRIIASARFAAAAVTPSQNVNLTVNFTGGVARVCSLVFNPTTGQIISSVNIIAAEINQFVANGTTWFVVSILAANDASGNTTVNMQIFPDPVTGNKSVQFYGPQIEAVAITTSDPTPSELILTGNDTGGTAPGTRLNATLPRQVVSREIPPIIGNGAYTLQPVDIGNIVYNNGGGAFTLTLPAISTLNEGFWAICECLTGTTTINTTGADTIVSAGIAPGATTMGIPSIQTVFLVAVNNRNGAGVITSRHWTIFGTAGAAAAYPTLTSLTNSLAADVALNNTGTYFTGPTIAQGAAGTWLAIGSVTLTDTAGIAGILLRLTDGTNIRDSGEIQTTNISGVGQQKVTLSAVFPTPPGNIRLLAKDVSLATGKILFNSSGDSLDSTLTVIKIAP
jgi:hypothetical protein